MWDFIKSKLNINWKTMLKTLKDAVLVAALNALALTLISFLPVELQDTVTPRIQEGLNWLYAFLGISVVANLAELRKKPV